MSGGGEGWLEDGGGPMPLPILPAAPHTTRRRPPHAKNKAALPTPRLQAGRGHAVQGHCHVRQEGRKKLAGFCAAAAAAVTTNTDIAIITCYPPPPDSILMYQLPAADDKEGRQALRRLQEVGVHVLAPAEALAAAPLPGAVAVMQLAVAASAYRAGSLTLPEGAARLALFVDGNESDADLAAVKDVAPALLLLKTAPGASRVHTSRRVFERLQAAGCDVPVVHHITFPDGVER